MKTKQMVLDAMFAALCAVLGYLALDFGNIKISFESLPVIIGALLFGPIDGLAIGGIGTFLYQMLRYGFSATTVLWMLPYVVCGLLVGLYAKKQKFAYNKKWQLLGVIIGNELLITILNTGVLYLDSKIYGYYFAGLILGSLFLRLVVCVAKSVVYFLIMPYILKLCKRILRK